MIIGGKKEGFFVYYDYNVVRALSQFSLSPNRGQQQRERERERNGTKDWDGMASR